MASEMYNWGFLPLSLMRWALETEFWVARHSMSPYKVFIIYEDIGLQSTLPV